MVTLYVPILDRWLGFANLADYVLEAGPVLLVGWALLATGTGAASRIPVPGRARLQRLHARLVRDLDSRE